MAGTMSIDNSVAPTLAREIREHHEAAHAAVRSALEHARKAGDKLTTVKASLPHGAFLPWLAEHCPDISVRTAQAYMRVAAGWSRLANAQGAAHLTLSGALALLAKPKAAPVPSQAADTTEPDAALDSRQVQDELRADVAALARMLTDPALTLDDCGAVVARLRTLEVQAAEIRIRAERQLGAMLVAEPWLDGLVRHPEDWPTFKAACADRMRALGGTDTDVALLADRDGWQPPAGTACFVEGDGTDARPDVQIHPSASAGYWYANVLRPTLTERWGVVDGTKKPIAGWALPRMLARGFNLPELDLGAAEWTPAAPWTYNEVLFDSADAWRQHWLSGGARG